MNATTKEIKREYKKQAMLIHPDKNPETEEQFKQLAAVYNILKDERTRAMYHRVLDEGLPEWRMPAFYDRQVQVVRHIGLIEGIITLFILATFIQYGMGWAQFLEPKKEKRVKKNKKAEVKEANKEEDDELASLRPSVYDTLPFQLYELMKQSPELIEYCKELWEERKLRKEQEAKEAEEEEERNRIFLEKKEAKKAGRKRITGESS